MKVLTEFNKYSAHGPEFERLYKEGRYEEERVLMNKYEKVFIDKISKKLGVTYTVTGRENIPEKGPVLVVANHQSYGDILAIVEALGSFQTGFIAKSEFKKVGFLDKAIKNTRSMYIDRGDARAVIKSLQEAKDLFDKGYSLTIFPEGTRSRGPKMNPFKPGAFKFAQKGKVPVLPVSISYAYKLYEDTGSVKPCHMEVKIHPLVHFEQMDKREQVQAEKDIEALIKSAVK